MKNNINVSLVVPSIRTCSSERSKFFMLHPLASTAARPRGRLDRVWCHCAVVRGDHPSSAYQIGPPDVSIAPDDQEAIEKAARASGSLQVMLKRTKSSSPLGFAGRTQNACTQLSHSRFFWRDSFSTRNRR
jgi:hypothetical protein